MSTVLILMSNTGGGHRSVAQALAGALKLLHGDEVDVVIADPFAFGERNVVDRLTYLYSPLIVRYPWLWGLVYYLTDNKPVFRTLMGLADTMMGLKMRNLFTTVRPEVVVSAHALCNDLAVRTRERLGWSVPVMTVLTDLVSIHTGWSIPGLAFYSAPTREAERVLRDRGIGPESVETLGLPIDQKFGGVAASQVESRRSLGLEEDAFTVLMIGGGEGAGNLFENAMVLANGLPDSQVLVVCGRNEKLRERLKVRLPVSRGRVYGFVHNVPEMMNAADVVVTKAGSVTIAETLAMRRPIILTDVLPGQEEGNIPFVERNNVGLHARSPRELLETVGCLAGDPSRCRLMSGNTLRVGKPRAAIDTARAVVELIPGSRRPQPFSPSAPRPVSRPVVWLGR